MAIAIYPRVSTGSQAADGTSLDAQTELCLKRISDLGHSLNDVIVYREEGASGEDIERPQLNRLRQDIASGLITHVFVTHPDRLSRDLTDKLFICREFESKGIALLFVDTEYSSTPEGQLFFNLMSVIAQYELALIKKRTVRGRLKAVERDKKIMPMRVPPFGYNFENQNLVVNEKEAEVVRNIYQWYIFDHLTLREIGSKLYDLGVSPKRQESCNWGSSSISRILNSEVYIGKYYYNRRKFKKVKGEKTKGGAPKKTYEFREKGDWILVEIEPIVDSALFELAQEQKVKNTTRSGNTKYEYLLKSIIRCSHCGRTWDCTTYASKGLYDGVKRKYTCYRCPNKNPKRYGSGVTACPAKTLRADLLEEFIWNLIMSVISDPNEYIAQLDVMSESVVSEIKQASELVRNQLNEKGKEIEKIKIMFMRDVINEEQMAEEIAKINVSKLDLQRTLDNYLLQLEAFEEGNLNAEKITLATERIKEFIGSNGSELSFEDKRKIVEWLIDEVRVHYLGNEVQITMIGHLESLLAEKTNKETDVGVVLHRKFKLKQANVYSPMKIVEWE
ncbi:recombinase family protein [Paenibacillus alginolyticus]|uniref:recombinase family protein n=1 Tax=Paenibacillus alginolyticus TaxID=59839 RepID=UPI000409207F|nr:recombinase family protein [Paenibacillus alginolyticus]MCY9663523.1 recombinase family protein [Paenibacillus alginolyticus]